MEEYLAGKDAAKTLGVHQRTLLSWDKKGIIETIRTPGNKRLYNVKKYLSETKNENNKAIKKEILVNNDNMNKEKNKYIYARVSSIEQKDDLENQKALLKEHYPKHRLIHDIGSGMNLNRKGLRQIIDKAIKGEIEEVVIVHKDRLCRFGYELIEDIIKTYSNGKIIIIEKENKLEPKEELVNDVLQIMNIFIAKINGMRKYEKNKNNKKDKKDKKIEK